MATRLRNKLVAEQGQIREAYRNGATLQEIGAVYNASPGTVRNILRDMGETLRPRGRRRREDVVNPQILDIDGVVEQCLDCSCDGDCTEEGSGQLGENTYEGGTF